MTLGYVSKLGKKSCLINVRIQKIDSFIFKRFVIVLASIWVKNKLKKARFFKITFLLADLNIEIVLEIAFFTFTNINI